VKTYYERQSIKMHREFDERSARMMHGYGVLTDEELAEKLSNIKDRTGDTCDVCQGAREARSET